jgi:hypothetical protein
MPARSSTESRLKAAVSVSEMARMCQLSRSHFNLLIRTGVMPQPLYSLHNRRPFYDAELQELCLRVRSTNTGADGRYVVFYDRRGVTPPPTPASSRTRTSRQQPMPRNDAHAELVEGLRALGLTDATAAQVDAALAACYPSGHGGTDEGTVLRELWRHLRRLNEGL